MSLARGLLFCALFGLAGINNAEAACTWVKDNPKCWGDVCPTHQVCTPNRPANWYCKTHPWVRECRF